MVWMAEFCRALRNRVVSAMSLMVELAVEARLLMLLVRLLKLLRPLVLSEILVKLPSNDVGNALGLDRLPVELIVLVPALLAVVVVVAPLIP